jgi:hypothetical protein
MSSHEIAQNDCPRPPGFRADVRTLILHEACQTAGGVGQLAQLLRVPVASVDRWLEGAKEAPDLVYQACIDIVLTHPDGASHS